MRASSLPSAAKLLPNDGEAQHDSSEPEHPYVTGSLGYNGKKDGKKMQTGFTHRPILVEGVDEPVQLHGVYACALRVEGARRRVDPRIGIGVEVILIKEVVAQSAIEIQSVSAVGKRIIAGQGVVGGGIEVNSIV